MPHITRKIIRPSQELVTAVGRYSSATLHEAQGRRGALSSILKPIDRAMSLCGPAFTVQCAPGDNLMLQLAIAYAQRGDVVVVSVGDFPEAGAFGDLLCTAAQTKGLAGLVIDTGVRDSALLCEMGFPVFSRSICIKGTIKETVGTINQPVSVGGQVVRPGDIIRGDADGLVLVLREEAADVALKAQAREEMEENKRVRYLRGDDVVAVNGLQAVIEKKGITFDD